MMIFKKLAIAATFALTAWSAQAATVTNVEAIVGGPTISGDAGPLNVLPGGATSTTAIGLTNDLVPTPILMIVNFLTPPNQFLATSLGGPPSPLPYLAGDFVDATDGAGFIRALYQTSVSTADFGSLFTVTLSNSAFTETTLDTGGFFGPAAPGEFTILVEAVATPIPVPAGAVLLLTALGGIGVMRRRSRKAA